LGLRNSGVHQVNVSVSVIGAGVLADWGEGIGPTGAGVRVTGPGQEDGVGAGRLAGA